MAKIGILTYHRSYNYGAFMQCYSLSHRLKKDFPNDEIEVIDYATERMLFNYPKKAAHFIFGSAYKKNSMKTALKNFAKLLLDTKMLKRKRLLYQRFSEDLMYLPLSEDSIISDNFRAFFEKIKDRYDAVIVGSDAVWEYRIYPFPNAYFLCGDLGKTKLLSYAASSDRMHHSDLNEKSRRLLNDAFSKFTYLGVRDTATESFLGHISSDLKLSHNCDPTVFLDISDLPKNLDRIKNDLTNHGIDLNRPIIGVMGGDELCKMLRKMFGKKYQIVSVYYYCKYADYYINDLSPIEWAQVFSLFSVTITRFFHGSLLSLKNGTPTIATDFWFKTAPDHETKIGDLYKRLDLLEHYFYMPDNQNNAGYAKIKERIEHYIQKPDTELILSALSKEAETYFDFKKALEKTLGR